ncbi:indole-3-glycerol phosphate synthase TrpC [Paenibacillus sp. KN14-4R]|uniref:indole-3-glycerol phosphate synthase TrpC n=1 Tax=Paenibacillus sp. KN14-4R TaxID=3445773 RepID=UPI003FA04997
MFLDRIVKTKIAEVEQLRMKLTCVEAERQIASMSPCRGFEANLTLGKKRSMGLIAEVKKASPSKGLIREDFQPVELAAAYERAGADCISVLTDRDYFQGSNAYLQAIQQTVTLPLLRKDFTVDPLQIYEARLIGADAVLLIAAILSDEQLKTYLTLIRDLGMDALVEVHDRSELERALKLDATLIGINNRDLRTFVTDLKTTEDMIAHIPKDRTVISESGISGAKDMGYLQQVGAHGVLVGEHLMRQHSVEEAVYHLMGRI